MEENEDSCLELFTFLKLYFRFKDVGEVYIMVGKDSIDDRLCFSFKGEAKVFLSNFPEKAAHITERCSKLLSKFRNWKLSEGIMTAL